VVKIRYTVRFLTAFLKRFKGLIFIGMAVGIAIFVTFKVISPHLLTLKTEKIGITGRHALDTLPDEVTELIGEGLTKINNEGIVEPSIAESWETTDSGRTWIFHIKDDVFWQDGKELRADELDFGFEDAQTETPDDKTIIFKLKEPFSHFPSVVSKPLFKKGLLSTGEWEVKKTTLVGNYFQEMTLVKKNGGKRIIKFYPTEDRSKLAFKLGEVNKLTGLFTSDPFDQWKIAKVTESANEDKVMVLFFNTQSEFFKDKAIRQGLDYAIDKEALGISRAISPISPNSWAYNPQVKQYNFDIDRAKELIGTPPEGLEIRISTPPSLLSVAEKIKTDWEAAGINSSVQVTSTIPEEYQVYLAILDIPKDPDQYIIWHSTQVANNLSHFQNARIDKLLEDGRTTLDVEERKKIYLDFQRFLVEELPAAFLTHPVTYTVERK